MSDWWTIGFFAVVVLMLWIHRRAIDNLSTRLTELERKQEGK